MQLTEMPKPNEYYNLTFEQWSETLEEIQDGRCHTVGATYHTTDGCNYYVVEIDEDGTEVNLQPKGKAEIDWGDGTIDPYGYYGSIYHTYNKGTYTIKMSNDNNLCGFPNNQTSIKEIYFKEDVDRSSINCRYLKKLKKICIPDNGTSIRVDNFFFAETMCLKSLVIGGSYIGGTMQTQYSTPVWRDLEYLVIDSVTTFGITSCINLKCFSAKNAEGTICSRNYSYGKLKHVVFDKVKTIVSKMFYVGGGYNHESNFNKLEVVDLPSTIESIENTTFIMGFHDMYIRSQTPPTLGGTSIGISNKRFHIRKDATYIDANGDTWTGLEAYAHATNWATLYSKTENTFIDDL
jgi:hypothetical protein